MIRLLSFIMLLLIASCSTQAQSEACFYRYVIPPEDYQKPGVADEIGNFLDERFHIHVSEETWPPVGSGGTFVYEDSCGQTEFDSVKVHQLEALGASLYFEPISAEEYFDVYSHSLKSGTR
jgi:hypothetical protein